MAMIKRALPQIREAHGAASAFGLAACAAAVRTEALHVGALRVEALHVGATPLRSIEEGPPRDRRPV